MERNWKVFWLGALKALKHVAIATLLVPIFFFMLNPQISQPGYWTDLLFSTRIGIQIALFYWIGLTTIFCGIYRYNAEIFMRLKQSIKFQIVLGLTLMALGLALTSLVEPLISGRTFGLHSMSIGLLIGGITFLLSIFYWGYRENRHYYLELRAESAETNLNVLKNQMQPHFLFNSLNSLAELIESNRPDASIMTQKLSDLYREILENSKSHLILVQREISVVQKYLELEKLRFGERLSYSIEVSQECQAAQIPSLTLQTLVENAVKHGISPCEQGGSINIKISKLASGFKAEIRNSGQSLLRSSSEGTGLKNTRNRLDLLYPGKHDFSLRSDQNSTFVSFWFSGVPNDPS